MVLCGLHSRENSGIPNEPVSQIKDSRTSIPEEPVVVGGSYAKHGGHTMYTERRPCKEAQMLSPRHLATIKQEAVVLDLCLRQNNAAVLLKRANVDLVNNLMRSER